MDSDPPSTSRTPKHSQSSCWLALIASLISAGAAAQTYQLVYSFRNLGETRAGLIQGSDGNLYGTTHFGGTSGVGTIFRVDAAGEFRTLHSFGHADGAFPDAELVEAADGKFYGTTSQGGAVNRGTVFRMNPSGRVERLHSFSGADGTTPVAAMVEASDGRFYGTTSEGGANEKGTIFRIDTSGNFELLHNFAGTDGAKPSAALIQAADGNFYGTTVEGGIDDQGTVFRMDSAGNLSTMRNLTWDDGIYPQASLVQAADGAFYGTTFEGGAAGAGTIFRMSSDGSFETVHTFPTPRDSLGEGANPVAALTEASDGYLYGTTTIGGDTSSGDGWGTIFRVNLTGNLTTLHEFSGLDGANPHAQLVQTLDGRLYGTTRSSGEWSQRGGTVFRLDSSSLTTLHEFPASEGGYPTGLIQASDGKFYGMTFEGGLEGNGTIFRVTPFGAFATLHNFTGVEGWGAQAALLEASDGYLYGATLTGGKAGGGALFRSDFSGNVTLVHEFSGPDGFGPASALIQASDGYLYGTASNGGDPDPRVGGTIFRMGFSGQWQTMHIFHGTDGAGPRGALLEASDGKFYGTTWGPFYHGTVFRISIDGEFESLHTFNGYDGVYPYDALIQATDGDFYGTTYGSIPGFGTVFKIDSSGNVTTLHRFQIPEAYGPQGGLVQAGDGDLYGTTVAGGVDNGLSGYGTAFRMTLEGNLTLIHLFNGFDGAGPSSKMIEASDGSLWGTADMGPLGGPGVIYRFSSDPVAVNSILPSSGPASEAVAVEILGGGFTQDAIVSFGDDSGTELTVLDPTFLYLFTPPLSPGTLNDVSVTVPDSNLGTVTATHPDAFFADFLDVPQADPFHDYVEKIFREGMTGGCGGGNYCRDDSTTRAQMSVFLLKAERGSAYVPPPCAGAFGDVPCPSMFADWIEQLAAEGITAGCGGGNYCPSNPVTRAQMAAFLLKAEHGSAYVPPPCAGLFADVSCPSLFADWIEELAAEKITGGCGAGNYCPDSPNTRAQMAAFLVKTFKM